jgi:hypothetical protein
MSNLLQALLVTGSKLFNHFVYTAENLGTGGRLGKGVWAAVLELATVALWTTK